MAASGKIQMSSNKFTAPTTQMNKQAKQNINTQRFKFNSSSGDIQILNYNHRSITNKKQERIEQKLSLTTTTNTVTNKQIAIFL